MRALVVTGGMVLASVLAVATSCGGASEGEHKIPPKPFNGSPIGTEFIKFTKGRFDKPAVDVRLYNFGDQPAVAYTFLLRYFDASGNKLKVSVGTKFEKDFDFMSQSGNKFRCNPKKHKVVKIEMLDVPKGATRAEILVSMVRTTKDGSTVVDWWKQKGWSAWPKDSAPSAAPAKAPQPAN